MKQQQTDLGKDPKTMVTPYAFAIADSVLYTPLATPLKRALAMLIDGIVITVLAEQMDWMFVLLVVGIIWIEKRSHKIGRMLKWGLYALMLAFMLLSMAADVFNFNATTRTASEPSLVGKEVVQSLPALLSLSLCEDYDCGKTEIQSLQRHIEDTSETTAMSVLERRDMLLNTLNSSQLSAIDKQKLQAEILTGVLWPAISAQTEPVRETNQKLKPKTLNPNAEVPAAKTDGINVDMLGGHSPESTYGDGNNDGEEEADTHSVIAWIKGFMGDMGLSFGWAAFYFTVFTARFDGQTLGKKLLGIRVIKLDGVNISLWAAFGRYGGYAAGFTTGLLGFMQIFWDANRQGIQDKISSTVVIDLIQMHKKQQLEQQQAQVENGLSPVQTMANPTSAHLTTSTRSEHL
ncbi:RDD family protein [Shewanella sp. CG12_big_fil_rev_8_21_14_0_65_47_15]|uniref:RDD family protein n=1 Tax=Shewanella sp. CG12_big_fil_rev_8_21_14_0_65_47_15 TaxID=1975537 RepID=UPI000CAE391E|nr:RDD family protein [Shewanella sp. CG12_big_fil_rev_8_21_14_0_65_47_15]PIW58847.1 MAG: RDD family protein [Shewanella sp. CG12_big_fil_rev_8_21_14_0_65_47_15]